MTMRRLNSDRLHRTAGYAHVTIVDAGPQAAFAGLCPIDRDGQLVGRRDVLVQTDQVVANAVEVLATAGATAADVIRSVVYVVSGDHSVLSKVWDRLLGSGVGEAFTSASTLLGVAALGYRDQLVEVELTAALSG